MKYPIKNVWMTIVKPYPTIKENSHLNNRIDFRMSLLQYSLNVDIYRKQCVVLSTLTPVIYSNWIITEI
jgi:hypothetical protein